METHHRCIFLKIYMRVLILPAMLIVTLLSCDNFKPGKAKTFTRFEFSYNDFFTTCFSIKFTQGDTAFIQQHFSRFSDTLKSHKSYLAILTVAERKTLDSFINKLNIDAYDTSYYQSYEDGDYYQFFIANDSLQKTIYIHSDSIPAELKKLSYWIVATKKKLQHFPIDTTIDFRSLKYFLLPPVPLPAINFMPPKVK
jgi:hypothetical protein